MGSQAYGDTKVAVSKSRDGIDSMLRKWGAKGVQWEDDFDASRSILRFRWSPPSGGELVARLVLQGQEINRYNSQHRRRSDDQMARLAEQERRRVHRVAYHWLKAQFVAVEAGLFGAEHVMLAHLEDAQGNTLAEALEPMLGQLGQMDAGRRLALPEGVRHG